MRSLLRLSRPARHPVQHALGVRIVRVERERDECVAQLLVAAARGEQHQCALNQDDAAVELRQKKCVLAFHARRMPRISRTGTQLRMRGVTPNQQKRGNSHVS